jgi:hypothetical protein
MPAANVSQAAITAAEWSLLVDRLNASFPSHQLAPETAAAWFQAVAPFHPAEVAAAVARMAREQFVPSLKALLDAIDALDRERRAAAAERARLERRERTAADRGRVDVPPETRAAIELLQASPAEDAEDADTAALRAEIERLADQLERRLAERAKPGSPSAEAAVPARRTCKHCAASPVPGLVGRTLPVGHPANSYAWPLEVWVPCRSCRPGRHEAWRAGRLTARCDQDGRPLDHEGGTR